MIKLSFKSVHFKKKSIQFCIRELETPQPILPYLKVLYKTITDFFQIPPETFVECYNSTDLTTNFQTMTPELSLILCLMTN